jgi:hypothetical protein
VEIEKRRVMPILDRFSAYPTWRLIVKGRDRTASVDIRVLRTALVVRNLVGTADTHSRIWRVQGLYYAGYYQ